MKKHGVLKNHVAFHSDLQIPPMTNYSMQGRTYRYYEGDPLYPFGYGLSYVTFDYLAGLIPVVVTAGQPLVGSFAIGNEGTVDAEEVGPFFDELGLSAQTVFFL